MKRLLLPLMLTLLFSWQIQAEVNHKNLKSSRVYSGVLKEYRDVRVLLPNEYDDTYYKYPTIYLLDGEKNFETGIEVLSFLMDNHFIPPHIVVGLPNTDRFRDMTPVDSILNKSIFPTRGGADNFIAALKTDIFPFISKNFRVNTKRTVMGHNYSGLFVVYAFYSHPNLFDKYLAFSPIMWWNNKAIVSDIDNFLVNNPSVRKHLFITFAEEATEMLKSCKSLISILETKSPSDLKWHYAWMPDEGHYTLYRKSLMQGMETIFVDYKFPDTQVLAELGVKAAKDYQRKILLTHGRNEKLPYSLLESVCLELKSTEKYSEAIEFLKYTSNNYPNRAETYYYAGEVFEKMNKPKEALKFYEIAHTKDKGRWDYEHKYVTLQKFLVELENKAQNNIEL